MKNVLNWAGDNLITATINNLNYTICASQYRKVWHARKHDNDDVCLASHQFESKEKAMRWCNMDALKTLSES